MSDQEKKGDPCKHEEIVPPETIACQVCLKEVPTSVAHTLEGDDYVLSFCGIECHDIWLHQNNTDKKPSTGQNVDTEK